MKKFMMLSLLSMSLVSFAQEKTSEENHAEVMMKVVELKAEVKIAQEAFEENKIAEGCEQAEKLVDLYKQHLDDAAKKMDADKRRTKKVATWALEGIIFFEQLKTTCSLGKDHEYVKSSIVVEQLEDVLKSLKKQKRKMNRDDLDSNNSYNYHYNFSVNAVK